MKRTILFALPVLLLTIWACNKDYSLELGGNTSSLGTLKDVSGNCSPIVIGGTYTENQSLGSSNTVDVTVTVATPGKYRIYTDTTNGFWFIDSGYFVNAGTYVVTLKGGGKPILPIQTDFTVNYGMSFCDFSITPAAAAGSGSVNAADTAWMFTEGAARFKGHIDSAVITSTTLPVYLKIYGKTATNDTTYYVQLTQSSPTPTGTYSTALGTAIFEFKTPAGNTIYDSNSTNGTDIIFTITNFNTTNKTFDATFTGTAKDAGNTTKTITSGKMKGQVK